MRFDGIIFDFDGVLLESEAAGNEHLAALLTELGFPHTLEDALAHYTGLSGPDFIAAIEARIGQTLPESFHPRRAAEDARVLAEELEEVAGAVGFVRSLPAEWPKAVASSSSTHWVNTHLAHLGLTAAFGDKVFSGKEHVTRGKPAPDLYLYAADALGIDIRRTVILEDSVVGVTGAVASGGHVIGLCAGSHCLPGHAETLKRLDVDDIAGSFDDVARLLGA
ncbi:HAD-IA family hydrolase [Sphingomonas sp. MAH-20]|uniref:HAD-IA family hydrolase n=1 Tax=Sphingomonas horti TaxID=2682842 RepID=A0A6I4IXJ8_9SPHN|nr:MULTISPECIES: HAD family phosphatase [Sphingomonas]MBA2920893.1 HAD family phosphatase [Sphingomonas sp. CGMCC 1.13658]MVO76879.1 HAD-IA family hydrolase [Sphingomonas horti]